MIFGYLPLQRLGNVSAGSPTNAMISHTESMKTALPLENVLTIDLTTFSEPSRGSLTVVESQQKIPFSIARIFYVYGVPSNGDRGAHAHREAEQVFIAVSGGFFLEVSNANQSKIFTMCEPHRAVYVPAMFWARVHNFSRDAICLVLTSTRYDPADYIRDWNDYISTVSKLAK